MKKLISWDDVTDSIAAVVQAALDAITDGKIADQAAEDSSTYALAASAVSTASGTPMVIPTPTGDGEVLTFNQASGLLVWAAPAYVAPPVPAIPPNELGGASLAAWYKPAAITGLTDGDALTGWPDSSANAASNSLTGVVSAAPKYRTIGGPSGQPYVDHTTAPGGLNSPAFPYRATQDFTFFMVVKPGTAGYETLFTTGSSGALEIRLNGRRVEVLQSGTLGLAISVATVPADVWSIVLVTYTCVGTITHLDVAGVIEDYALGGDIEFGTVGFNYGNYEGTSAFFGGQMAEFGLYSSVLAPGDLASLKDYLTSKYIA